jgi:hypothetical protein
VRPDESSGELSVRRRAALGAGAALCLVVACALFLLAVDTWRWHDTFDSGDALSRVAPENDPWQPRQVIPFSAARRALGVDDDLAYRRALRAFRLARPEDSTVSDPSLALERSDAQARLATIVQSGHDPALRSTAANLVGVLEFARSVSEGQGQVTSLQAAVTSFREAIRLDPTNGDAKHNLELALQRGSGKLRFAESGGGANPAAGGRGAKGAGTADAGTGY